MLNYQRVKQVTLTSLTNGRHPPSLSSPTSQHDSLPGGLHFCVVPTSAPGFWICEKSGHRIRDLDEYLQYDAIWCNMMQYDAIWCNMMQYDAIWCNSIRTHTQKQSQTHMPISTCKRWSAVLSRTRWMWQQHGRLKASAFEQLDHLVIIDLYSM